MSIGPVYSFSIGGIRQGQGRFGVAALRALAAANISDHLVITKWQLILEALESKSVAPRSPNFQEIARANRD